MQLNKNTFVIASFQKYSGHVCRLSPLFIIKQNAKPSFSLNLIQNVVCDIHKALWSVCALRVRQPSEQLMPPSYALQNYLIANLPWQLAVLFSALVYCHRPQENRLSIIHHIDTQNTLILNSFVYGSEQFQRIYKKSGHLSNVLGGLPHRQLHVTFKILLASWIKGMWLSNFLQ